MEFLVTVGAFDSWLPVVSDSTAGGYIWAPPSCLCNSRSSQTHCSRGGLWSIHGVTILCTYIFYKRQSVSQSVRCFLCNGHQLWESAWVFFWECELIQYLCLCVCVISECPQRNNLLLLDSQWTPLCFLQPNQISRDVARWHDERPRPQCPFRPGDGHSGMTSAERENSPTDHDRDALQWITCWLLLHFERFLEH